MTRNKTLKCILSFSKHAKTYNPFKMPLASPERVATTNRLRRTHCQKLMGTLHSNESIKICSKRIVKRKVVGIRSILRVLLDEKRFWRWKVSSSSHGHTHTDRHTGALLRDFWRANNEGNKRTGSWELAKHTLFRNRKSAPLCFWLRHIYLIPRTGAVCVVCVSEFRRVSFCFSLDIIPYRKWFN